MKTLKTLLHSGHEARLSPSAGLRAGLVCGVVFRRRNDDMADREDDGRALRAISLFSTSAITSLTGLTRTSGVPSVSRRMSES